MIKDVKQKQAFSRRLTRRDFLSTGLKAGAAAFTTGLLPKRHVNAQGQYNVLFIIADDLRPLLGCYGHPEIHTPNIDRLAERGILFNRAYCQVPLCNPSRTSLLTGLRPQTTGILGNAGDFRQILPEVLDVQQYFNEHGYVVHSVGKVAHAVVPFIPGPSSRALDVPDDAFTDGQTAKETEGILADIKNQRFFLAVGFEKPHLPFHVPRKYYDLYNTQTFDLPVTSDYPKNSPFVARNSINIFRYYSDIPSGDVPISEEKTLELIRAYAASTSYMDAQVGRVLNQLDSLGLTEDTVVVFCGDHGFHLGEHGTWRKNTLFEVALRSPMIISVPGQQPSRTDALVELVDIYPTLCEACEMLVPSELEGLSLMPVIEQPTRPWKTAAFSQRGESGWSMRTTQYRYTEWGRDGKGGRELYDYDADPDETVNIVDLPENAELVSHLSERLHAGWQAALPEVNQQVSVPRTLPWDINNDGVVDIRDLVLISSSFGEEAPAYPKVDVNKDGKVNIFDLLLVVVHFGESSTPTAPALGGEVWNPETLTEHFDLVEQWLTQARLSNDGSLDFQQGIAALERLINTAIPKETALLVNYPNPFNPETWIPYDLAEDSDVEIHIYNVEGESVRRLSLGFQGAGTYRTRSRAAYWDGRNAVGEPVASGVYFYTLQAGHIKATRQMVILK